MNIKNAIRQMATGEKTDEAIQAIYDAVEPKCKTSTDGDNGETTTLWDWLSETGGYTGNETPARIAHEWDSLSNTP